MNPQEPVLPEPDAPVENPSNPVEEPPVLDGVDSYETAAGAMNVLFSWHHTAMFDEHKSHCDVYTRFPRPVR